MENAESMALPACYPKGATFEQSYMMQILGGGEEFASTKPRPAPAWAIRGPRWSPAKAGKRTLFRFQPDVWYSDAEDPDVVCVDDYKTALGMLSDSAVSRETQVVLYAAAIALLTGAERVRFTLWNLRWKQGQQVEKSRDEWLAEAQRVWSACYFEDQKKVETLEADPRPASERCGTCQFFGSAKNGCWPAAPNDDGFVEDDLSAEALLVSSRWHRAMATRCSAKLREILKARTSVLKLDDGTILGPHQRRGLRWLSKRKGEGIRLASTLLEELGFDVGSYLGTGGDSLLKWHEGLPPEVRAALEGLLKETTTTTFITHGEQDWLASQGEK